jgi:hypothetical protein
MGLANRHRHNALLRWYRYVPKNATKYSSSLFSNRTAVALSIESVKSKCAPLSLEQLSQNAHQKQHPNQNGGNAVVDSCDRGGSSSTRKQTGTDMRELICVIDWDCWRTTKEFHLSRQMAVIRYFGSSQKTRPVSVL